MTLTLEVIGPHAAALGGNRRKVFTAGGGTIGRVPDNDWVLPDPYVSSYHARIRHDGTTFFLEDTSRNGVYINEQPVAKHEPRALASGDAILIEPYEIRASITSDSLEVPQGVANDPFGLDSAFGLPPTPERGPGLASILPGVSREPMPGGEMDPLRLLGFEPASVPAAHVPRAVDLAQGSLLAEPYRAPAVQASTPVAAPPAGDGGIPADYDPLRSDSQFIRRPAPASSTASPPASDAPRAAAQVHAPSSPAASSPARATPPSRRVPAHGTDETGMGAVLRHAGIEGVTGTPELARSFGRILRIVVSGVMDVLQARQRIKEEFRMRTTTFKPKENNPLKFSANVDDALHNLLVKRNAAFFEPVQAFEDAFDDVRHHQMAMLAGVRAAFEAMLGTFDPDRLQGEFDRQPRRGALLSMPAKLRYWEMYREKVHGIVKDPDASFRELFGDEFARAYEEQLDRLKGSNHEPR